MNQSYGKNLEAFEARLARLEKRVAEGGSVQNIESVSIRTTEMEKTEEVLSLTDAKEQTVKEEDVPPFDIEESAVVRKDIPLFDTKEPEKMEVSESSTDPERKERKQTGIENIEETKPHSMEKSELWEKLVDDLQGKVDIGTFIVISDDYNVYGNIVGEELVIRTKDKFCTNRVKDPEVQEQIRKALIRIHGHALPIRVVEVKTKQAMNTEKLNALERFPNVIVK